MSNYQLEYSAVYIYHKYSSCFNILLTLIWNTCKEEDSNGNESVSENTLAIEQNNQPLNFVNCEKPMHASTIEHE